MSSKFKVVSIAMSTIFLFLSSCSSESNTNKSTSSACSHDYVSKIIEATCVQDGYTLMTCSKCHDSYKKDLVSALGHSYVERTQNYRCSRCERDEDTGFSFDLITSEMARYNDTYDGKVDTYYVTSTLNSAIENGKVTIPRKHLGLPVVKVNKGALYNVRAKISELNFQGNIKYVGSNLFNYDGQMYKNNEIPTIEKVVFDSDCSNICISHSAFFNCYNLSEVSYPSKCFSTLNHDDSVGNHFLFEGTKYYENNVVKEEGMYYLDDLLLGSDKAVVSSNINIKSNTRMIGNYCFNANTNIKSVTLPKSIIYIGKASFENCVNLSEIIFKGTEAQFNNIVIESSAFKNVSNITYKFEN